MPVEDDSVGEARISRRSDRPQVDDDVSTSAHVSNEGFVDGVQETFPRDRKEALPSRIYHYIYVSRLELFFFLYAFSRFMVTTPIGDLLLQKACLNNLRYNTSTCDHLDTYPDIKDAAEKIASSCGMFRTVIGFAPSAVIAVFIGPWCDKYGYKTPLLISNMGCMISTALVLLTAYLMYLLSITTSSQRFRTVLVEVLSLSSWLCTVRQRHPRQELRGE